MGEVDYLSSSCFAGDLYGTIGMTWFATYDKYILQKMLMTFATRTLWLVVGQKDEANINKCLFIQTQNKTW